MQIRYELKKEDYLNFNMYNMRHSKIGKVALAKFRFFLMSLHLIIAIILVTLVKVNWFIGYPVFLVVGIIQLFLSRRNFEKTNIKKIARLISDGAFDNLFGEYSLDFLEDGFIEISPTGENKVLWKDINRMEEYESYLYLFIDEISAYIIPKRAFEDRDSIEKITVLWR